MDFKILNVANPRQYRCVSEEKKQNSSSINNRWPSSRNRRNDKVSFKLQASSHHRIGTVPYCLYHGSNLNLKSQITLFFSPLLRFTFYSMFRCWQRKLVVRVRARCEEEWEREEESCCQLPCGVSWRIDCHLYQHWMDCCWSSLLSLLY